MRLPVVVAVVETVVARALRLVLATGEMRVVLAELLLRHRDHAVIVLGMLVVIFRGDRITRGLRVARELNVFFRDVRRISANFHIGPVRFVDAHHRIVILAMVVVASAHALVLTVSHDSPVANPFIVAACCRRASPKQFDTLSHQQHASICVPARSSRSKIRRLGRDVRFRVAKQQPLDRSIPRCCPPLPHGHVRLARGSAPNR